MSLRVWLPFNGTLDNQGLDNVVVTNNGATVDNNGKIGKCYSFDGSNSGININGNIISTLAQGDFSICFWVYNDDQGNRSIYIATIPSSSYAFAIQKTTGEGLRVYWQSSPDYYPTNFTVPIQEWCHITVVIKNNNCYCYKNGVLITSREDGSFTPQKLTNTWLYGMLGRDLRTGATVLKGKINDFRWYDHALSPMEIKQISQGLILHYLLNDKGFNNNIEYDCSGYCNNGIKKGTFQYKTDTPKYSTSTYAQGSSSTYLEGVVLPAEAKTVSLWVKCAKTVNSAIFNDRIVGLQIGLLNSLLYVNSLTSTKGFTTTHWKNNEWNHVVVINDNGVRRCYVNGQAETQSGATNYYIHNTDKFWVWKRSYNDNYTFKGSLSDLRIYCTALSAEDVLSLYHNSAYIDNQGNIYGAIYEEV